MPVRMPTRSRAACSAAAAAVAATAASQSLRTCCAAVCRTAPAAVRLTRRESRSSSRTCNAASSAPICLLNAGCETCRRSAARVKLSSSATAPKYRRSRRCASTATGYTSGYWPTGWSGTDTRSPHSDHPVPRRTEACHEPADRAHLHRRRHRPVDDPRRRLHQVGVPTDPDERPPPVVGRTAVRLSPSRRARSWGVRVSTVNRSGLTAPETTASPRPGAGVDHRLPPPAGHRVGGEQHTGGDRVHHPLHATASRTCRWSMPVAAR